MDCGRVFRLECVVCGRPGADGGDGSGGVCVHIHKHNWCGVEKETKFHWPSISIEVNAQINMDEIFNIKFDLFSLFRTAHSMSDGWTVGWYGFLIRHVTVIFYFHIRNMCNMLWRRIDEKGTRWKCGGGRERRSEGRNENAITYIGNVPGTTKPKNNSFNFDGNISEFVHKSFSTATTTTFSFLSTSALLSPSSRSYETQLHTSSPQIDKPLQFKQFSIWFAATKNSIYMARLAIPFLSPSTIKHLENGPELQMQNTAVSPITIGSRQLSPIWPLNFIEVYV